jgi:transcription initiation factor TFIID subunit 15
MTQTDYLAPAQVDGSGTLIGHTHIVVQPMFALCQDEFRMLIRFNSNSADSTDIRDSSKFVFFKGVNDAGNNGVVSVEVTPGLPAGTYTIGSLNAAANHQPPLPAIAQRGMG